MATTTEVKITKITPKPTEGNPNCAIFTFDPPPPAGGYSLKKGDKIKLNLLQVLDGLAFIDKVTIYTDNNGKKGTSLGTFTVGSGERTIQHTGKDIYKISRDRKHMVFIEDVESPGADERYHFGATVENSFDGTIYDGDPMMVNKP